MTISSSIGYGGTVDEDDMALWRQSFAGSYGVVGASDWRVAVKPAVDRTVTIAAGYGFGHAVIDTNSVTEAAVSLATLASGTRWDLIVAHRNWSGSGGTTTFDKVTGTSVQTAVFALRDQTPGTEDDQPLALVQVNGNGGGGVIANVIDLRVWQSNGGSFATSDLVLQYLTDVGTQIRIGTNLWQRSVDVVGSAVWTKTPVLSPVNILAVGSSVTGGTPATDAVFYQQTGTVATTTDGSGNVGVFFPSAFANGVVSVIAVSGDDSANPGMTVHLYGYTTTGFSYRPRIAGALLGAGYNHRISYIATGY